MHGSQMHVNSVCINLLKAGGTEVQNIDEGQLEEFLENWLDLLDNDVVDRLEENEADSIRRRKQRRGS